MKLVDLTQPWGDRMPTWPQFASIEVTDITTHHRDGKSTVLVKTNMHTGTHIDALCHLPTAEGDAYYNGAAMGPGNLPARRKGTIEHWRHGVVTRGVLYDVPRLRGTECVAPGRAANGFSRTNTMPWFGAAPLKLKPMTENTASTSGEMRRQDPLA